MTADTEVTEIDPNMPAQDIHEATAPYHEWPSNFDADKSPSFDRCQRCKVWRFPATEVQRLKAAGPCPKPRPKHKAE